MITKLQQDVINTTFNGDKEAYERAWVRTTKDTLNWSSIVETSTLSTELTQKALHLVEYHFGFLPDLIQVTRYLPVIGSIVMDYQNKLISHQQLLQMSHDCLIHLRNQILFLHSEIKYPDATYRDYALLPIEHKLKAKARFKSFLGYLPLAETSIQCELAISSVISNDESSFSNNLTSIDCKMLTIIKYRELLLNEGKPFADKSPLPVIPIKISNNCHRPISF